MDVILHKKHYQERNGGYNTFITLIHESCASFIHKMCILVSYLPTIYDTF